MATAPGTFFRFLSDNTDLVLAVFDRGEVDEAELAALIDRYQGAHQASADHIRRQIQDLGIVERAAHADAVFELAPAVQDLLRWLTHRQRLASATVLRAYFDEISSIGGELDQAVARGDAGAVALALRDADGLVERVRSLSDGNREAIVTEVQSLRTAGSDVSAVQRFQTVRRMWERYLEPLRQLVDVRGEMEQRLDRLRRGLEEGERRFVANGAIHRGLGRTLARLARMQRAAFDDHLAALQEIAPLYDRLRRDSRWVLGASQALQVIRDGGATALNLDHRLALVGWRTRYLMSDEKLRARLAGLVGYVPEGAIVLGTAPPRPDVPLITREELREALVAASPVADVLELLLVRWPDHPVQAQLIAFGQVVGGSFGTVELAPGAEERTYHCQDVVIRAWPVGLAEVAA